ncbi:hypothetical protein CPC08DRAFT_714313 [Agrocybe pediades]|nr:hypothetical protein CPC08DRAFT_714313 [Agrocybe pediades]
MPFSLYQALGVPGSSGWSTKTTKFDAAHKFVTSPFQPLYSNPFYLAGTRLLVATYIWVVILFTLIWDSVRLGTGDSYFSYFTYLTYIGLCAYYTASSYHTISYALRWRRRGAGAGYSLNSWNGGLGRLGQALYVVLYSSVVTFPVLVTIVFWSILASPDVFKTRFSSFSNISVHALNSLFALIEIFLTNSPPPPWAAMPLLVLILGAYLGVAYITKAAQGFYVYPFLNPSVQHGKLAAYIVGIAVAECIIFVIVRYVIVFRRRWAMNHNRVLRSDDSIIRGSAGINGQDEERGDRTIEGLEGEDDWEQVESPNMTSSPTKSTKTDRTVREEAPVKVEGAL